MRAIDELRRLPDFGTVIIDGDETDLTETMVCVTRAQLNAISDAIERELEESYVELPRDANGEHIHIGDKLMGKYLTGNPVVECTRLTLTNDWMVGHGRQDGTANLFAHYKPPTVEDVLREFALACEDAGYAGHEVETIASEFAERLRLREDG